MTVAGVTALAGVAAFIASIALRPAPIDAPETRLELNTPSTSDPLSFAISPDGRELVFV